MQRGQDTPGGGGLGPGLAGEKIAVNKRIVSVVRQIGEGGFSFAYLVKDIFNEDSNSGNSANNNNSKNNDFSYQTPPPGSFNHNSSSKDPRDLVLKITSIHNRQQRDIAEKEAKLLGRLSHPSIIRIVDSCYRTVSLSNSGSSNVLSGLVGGNSSVSSSHSGNTAIVAGRAQHLILMEYCEGGTAYQMCNTMKTNNAKFSLPSLIIAFGQICNAVSYLHAQRPPIVHRDLKPVNFLVKNGAYKLCDFGSAVFGHVDLRTPRARNEAEEVIQKTTTQMFRAPEMIDLFMAKKLTQSTDVWALGCCLYSLAFFQNCFEEGSNLAILSRNYKIPENNPYGNGLVELIDRMLTVNYKERADMTEIILCLSAIYSGRPLPPRKRKDKNKKAEISKGGNKEDKERIGTFRTDGQGIRESTIEPKKPVEAKKLNPNSAAARRRRAAKQTALDNNSNASSEKIQSSPQQSQKSRADFSSSPDPFKFSKSQNTALSETTSLKGPLTNSSGDSFLEKNESLGFENFNSELMPSSFTHKKDANFASFDKYDEWGSTEIDSKLGVGDDEFVSKLISFTAQGPNSESSNITPTKRLDFDPQDDTSSANAVMQKSSKSNQNGPINQRQSDQRRRSKSLNEANRDSRKESPEKKRVLKGFKNLFRKNENKTGDDYL